MPTLIDSMRSYGFLFLWRDGIEILCFVIAIYWMSRWLSHDKTKPLLAYFYAYSGMIIASYALPLPTIYTLLVTAWPCALTVALLMHQRILQRNFIGLNALSTPAQMHNDWAKELVRATIQAAESGRYFTLLVQHTHDLSSLISTPLPLNLRITQQVLHILFESNLVHTNSLLWIDSKGYIRGANITYKSQDEITPTHDDAYRHIAWALSMTQHNDALLCIAQPSGMFDIVAQGKLIQNMPAHTMIRYLKNYCAQIQEPLPEVRYESKSTTQARNN